jgi:hypothetical protein
MSGIIVNAGAVSLLPVPGADWGVTIGVEHGGAAEKPGVWLRKGLQSQPLGEDNREDGQQQSI